MLNRKLLISSLTILCRRSRPSSCYLADLCPNFESSRTLHYSHHQAGESRVSRRSSDMLEVNYAFLGRNFCSGSSDISVVKCWNCGKVAASNPFLACESCRSVQPVDPSVDYFQIFGLEKVYDIEDGSLERKYKNWQKKLHPDLVHTKSEKEKEYAAEQSARVIDAYRTLRNSLSRAIYLLRLEGVDVDEEQTVSEPELLAEILEIREAVEEAPNPPALRQIQCQVQGNLDHWSKSFENAFKNRKFEEAITSIQRMTYYHRIDEEIIRKL